jgi:thioredoxin-like negative regulator of GroEL
MAQLLNRTDTYRIAERASSLLDNGCFAEAAILFAGLRALDSQDAYAANGLAASYIALGRSKEALEILAEILQQQPRNPIARARRCEIYLHLRQLGEAKKDLDQLRTLGDSALLRRAELMFEAAKRNFSGDRKLPEPAGDN